MDEIYLKELKEEMSQLKLEECTRDEILDFVEKILLLSERLLYRVYTVERKLDVLEQKQERLILENNKLASNMDKVISLAGENPRAAMAILLQLNDEGKKPGIIN